MSTSQGAKQDSEERHDRLLPWIAAERAFRAIVLLVVGIVLISHPHTNWAGEIRRVARDLGLNPHSNWIQRILHDVAKVGPSRTVVFGVIAIGYAILEGFEAVGLWRRRRWGEWLTVIATSLLLLPEIWELSRSATALKIGALLVNLAIVVYLLMRLGALPAPRRRRSRPA